MKDYKYVLTREYPFFKKRKLTQLEIIDKTVWTYFELIPIVYIICFFAMIIGFISSLLNLHTNLGGKTKTK